MNDHQKIFSCFNITSIIWFSISIRQPSSRLSGGTYARIRILWIKFLLSRKVFHKNGIQYMDMDNFIDKTEPLRTLTIEIFRFKLCNVIDEMNSHNDCFFFFIWTKFRISYTTWITKTGNYRTLLIVHAIDNILFLNRYFRGLL